MKYFPPFSILFSWVDGGTTNGAEAESEAIEILIKSTLKC